MLHSTTLVRTAVEGLLTGRSHTRQYHSNIALNLKICNRSRGPMLRQNTTSKRRINREEVLCGPCMGVSNTLEMRRYTT